MDKEYIEKKERLYDLLPYGMGNNMFRKFFDIESNSLLDEKIEVLEALKLGKEPKDIPKFNSILELLKNDEMWD